MTTPNEFDTLVRDTLRAVDAATTQDGDTADRLIANAREGATKVVPLRQRQPRPAWIAPLIAAAVVVAVALAVVLATNRRTGGPQRPANSQPPTSNATTTGPSTPTPSTSAPTSAPSTAPTTAEPAPKVAGFTTSDVSYLDAKRGWALGDGRCATGARSTCATILRTQDGGKTWHRIGVPAGLTSTRDSASCGNNGTIVGPCVDEIVFATQKVGYLWSFRDLYLTKDGGSHWSDLGVQRVTEVVVVGDRAIRLTARAACSEGCSYGVFAAPLGTNNWTQVIAYTPEGGGDAQLVSSRNVAYVLEQLPSQTFSAQSQRLYRSTDGTRWTRVTAPWPCGTKAIDGIGVTADGALTTTCS